MMRVWILGVAVCLLCLTGMAGTGETFGLQNQENAWMEASSSEMKSEAPNYLQIGMDLEKKESIGFLKQGLSAQAVREKLGEPEESSAPAVWGADGAEHQDWFYPSKGIRVNLIRKGDSQNVFLIRIKTPCDFATAKGIRIGSTAADLDKAYGDSIDRKAGQEGVRVVAGSVYGGMIFFLEDGLVSGIFLGAAAE